MKKLLSISLALVLALSLAAPAFASTIGPNKDDPTGEQTGSSPVEYTIPAGYLVTIPEEVVINGDEAVVLAEGVMLDEGASLVVKLTGTSTDAENYPQDTNAFTVRASDEAVLTYTVKDGNDNLIDLDNNTVLTVEAGLNNEVDKAGNETGASTGSTQLTFALPESEIPRYAGKYTGTVTFTISVQQPAAEP